MPEIIKSGIYEYKSHQYIVTHRCKIKINGEWVDGIMYQDKHHNNFVRTEEEFLRLFEFKH